MISAGDWWAMWWMGARAAMPSDRGGQDWHSNVGKVCAMACFPWLLVKTVVEPMVSKIFHSSGMALFLKSEFTSTFRVNSIQIFVAWWVGLHIISYLWINWMDSLFLHCVALNLIVPCEGPILIWNISSNSRVSCHQVISLPSCSCQYYVISMITLVSSMYALLVSNSCQHA